MLHLARDPTKSLTSGELPDPVCLSKFPQEFTKHEHFCGRSQI
jgi:hypothetical protein